MTSHSPGSWRAAAVASVFRTKGRDGGRDGWTEMRFGTRRTGQRRRRFHAGTFRRTTGDVVLRELISRGSHVPRGAGMGRQSEQRQYCCPLFGGRKVRHSRGGTGAHARPPGSGRRRAGRSTSRCGWDRSPSLTSTSSACFNRAGPGAWRSSTEPCREAWCAVVADVPGYPARGGSSGAGGLPAAAGPGWHRAIRPGRYWTISAPIGGCSNCSSQRRSSGAWKIRSRKASWPSGEDAVAEAFDDLRQGRTRSTSRRHGRRPGGERRATARLLAAADTAREAPSIQGWVI